uniref:NADH deshydrogenase subunit 6 n=1 Tax=Tragiscus dimidiatus TaxID=206935 RepID=A0A1X9HDS9_9SCAR|nr:NADH deshydrogenase subunit 6 [Tragiscus dimidiatus]
MILMITMLFFSLLMIWLNHPLSLGVILLLQTINLSLYMGFFYLNYWFSYILFLIMIGSMLILFIYMTSIASNEKFFFSMNLFMFSMFTISLLMTSYMMMNSFYLTLNNKIENSEFKFMFMLTKYTNFPNLYIYYFLIIYLLITLIIIIQITNYKKSGALRPST